MVGPNDVYCLNYDLPGNPGIIRRVRDDIKKVGDGVYLSTDDWRLPAIHVYLSLGWQPLIYAPDMEARWEAVFNGLQRDPEPGLFVIEPR